MYIDVDNAGNVRFNIPGDEIRLCNKVELFTSMVQGKEDNFLQSFVITSLSAVNVSAKHFEGDAVAMAVSETNDVSICVLHNENDFFTDKHCMRTDIPLSVALFATKNALKKISDQLDYELNEDKFSPKDKEFIENAMSSDCVDEIRKRLSSEEEDDDDISNCNAYMLSTDNIWNFVKFSKINNVIDPEIGVFQDERDGKFFSYILAESLDYIPLMCQEYFKITKVMPELVLVEEHNHPVGTLEQLSQF